MNYGVFNCGNRLSDYPGIGLPIASTDSSSGSEDGFIDSLVDVVFVVPIVFAVIEEVVAGTAPPVPPVPSVAGAYFGRRNRCSTAPTFKKY